MDTGLCGLLLGLLWGDAAESRVEPLAIAVAFDGGEQVPFSGLASRVALLVDKLRLGRSPCEPVDRRARSDAGGRQRRAERSRWKRRTRTDEDRL